MRKYVLLILLPFFLYAHKINLFTEYSNNNLYISSYFANGKGCTNCILKIKDENNILLLEDKLNSQGEYNYKTSQMNLKITIDAGSGHITSKDIFSQEIKKTVVLEDDNKNQEIVSLLEKNKALENKIKLLEEKLDYMEIFKVIIGLLLIFLIFLFLKRIKN